MKIKILGTRGEIKVSEPLHNNHSGILIDDKILIDIGEKKFLNYRPKYIFITHLHPDHAYFVRHSERLGLKAFAPETYRFDINIQRIRKAISLEGYRITPIPTIHSKLVKSQGYLVEKDKKRIFYSGDIIWIEKKYHKFLRDLDLVITEASFVRKGGAIRRSEGRIFGHNGLPDLVKLFAPFAKKILFIHFGSWIYKDFKNGRKQIEQIARQLGVKAITGYDGQDYSF